MKKIQFISTESRRVQHTRSDSATRSRIVIGYAILIALSVLGLHCLNSNRSAIAAEQTVAADRNTSHIDKSASEDISVETQDLSQAPISAYIALLSQTMPDGVVVTRLSLQSPKQTGTHAQSIAASDMQLRIQGVASPGQSILDAVVALERSQAFDEVRVERYQKLSADHNDAWEYQILMRPNPSLHLSEQAQPSVGR